MTTCLDCENTRKTEYLDPRTPPLDVELCLCYACYKLAVLTVIETASDDMSNALTLGVGIIPGALRARQLHQRLLDNLEQGSLS